MKASEKREKGEGRCGCLYWGSAGPSKRKVLKVNECAGNYRGRPLTESGKKPLADCRGWTLQVLSWGEIEQEKKHD